MTSTRHFRRILVAKFELIGLHRLHRFEVLGFPFSDVLSSVLRPQLIVSVVVLEMDRSRGLAALNIYYDSFPEVKDQDARVLASKHESDSDEENYEDHACDNVLADLFDHAKV